MANWSRAFSVVTFLRRDGRSCNKTAQSAPYRRHSAAFETVGSWSCGDRGGWGVDDVCVVVLLLLLATDDLRQDRRDGRAMKKFTFKGVLDGIRSSVAPQIKPDQEIVETLRSDNFQVAKVSVAPGPTIDRGVIVPG